MDAEVFELEWIWFEALTQNTQTESNQMAVRRIHSRYKLG